MDSETGCDLYMYMGWVQTFKWGGGKATYYSQLINNSSEILKRLIFYSYVADHN